MNELLMAIAKQIVDNPDQVQVREQHGEGNVVLVLSVAKQDIGMIIGKQGRNITAIRTIMNAAAAKLHKRVVVELKE